MYGKKALLHLGETLGWSTEDSERFYRAKVADGLEWNQLTGNAYTASLWISVARALVGLQEGVEITAFSYGSGYGAELLQLTAGPAAAEAPWVSDVEQDLATRQPVDMGAYETLRGHARATA